MEVSPSPIVVVLGLAIFFVFAVYPNTGRSLIKEGDMRTVLAFLFSVSAIAAMFLNMWIKGGTGMIPDWLLTATMMIIGYFYRDKSASEDAQRVVDATAANVATAATVAASVVAENAAPHHATIVNTAENPIPVEQVKHQGGGE